MTWLIGEYKEDVWEKMHSLKWYKLQFKWLESAKDIFKRK